MTRKLSELRKPKTVNVMLICTICTLLSITALVILGIMVSQ
jgi:hypothetical protein